MLSVNRDVTQTSSLSNRIEGANFQETVSNIKRDAQKIQADQNGIFLRTQGIGNFVNTKA